ncbi:MAG TPA: outer membrane protein assembly factor BamA, partial [Bacteroidetes bacterium]|nr:outer membrane protein assembly factor BamA [Bacteroidota bacterium]
MDMRKNGLVLIIFSLFLLPFSLQAQTNQQDLLSKISYDHPQKYVIGDIDVSGINYLDKSVVIMLSDLEKGQRIKVPGDDITTAIHNLWNQGLFDDVRILATKVKGDTIYLDIYLQEKPKLNKFSFTGIKKSEQDDLKDKINLTHGDVVSSHLIMRTENIIKNFYRDKGYLNAQVSIFQKEAGPRTNK